MPIKSKKKKTKKKIRKKSKPIQRAVYGLRVKDGVYQLYTKRA